MVSPTGAFTELWYYWEEDSSSNPDFGAGAGTNDSTQKVFGGDATFDQFEGSNNAVDVFQPGSRKLEELVSQQFEGAFSISFEWTNPWWLQGLIADPGSPTDNADGTYTYTYDGDTPYPMAIYAGYEDTAGGPRYRILEGSVIASAEVSVNVEGTVDVTLTGAYANEDNSVTTLKGQPSLDYGIMNFADAFVNLDGSTISLVQDASLEVNGNVDVIYELGDRTGVDYSPKGLIPSIDYTKIRKDNNEVTDMYGSDAATAVQQNVDQDKDVVFNVDNGLAAGSGMNKAEFDMTGSFPDSVSVENFGDPTEDLQQSINRRMSDVSATATNDTSTHP